MACPPNINARTVTELLLKLYPFALAEESSVKQLDGFEDRNYYFKGVLESDDNQQQKTYTIKEYVLKVFNVCNSYELIEGVTGVLKHLKKKDFRCCFPITSRNGTDVEVLSENQVMRGDPSVRAGRRVLYCVCVLTFIPGDLLCDVKMTKVLAYEAGSLVGSMDALLQDFIQPAIDNRVFSDPIWDARNFLQIEGLLPSIEDLELRKIVKVVMADFKTSVLPQIPSMSHGILHYDASCRNIIVQKTDTGVYHVAGIIDFTDSLHCPHVFELAILVAKVLSLWDCDPVENVCSVIAGYCHSFPLSQDDLRCLYTLVTVRLCTVIVAVSLNYECGEKGSCVDSTSGYHSRIVAECRRTLDEIMMYSKEQVNEIWLGVLNS